MSINNYVLLVISRALAFGANLLVAYVVSTNLSSIEQGFFYAFQSLGAAQFFFDLGVGFVLANIAGRRVAKAHIDGCSELEALSAVLTFSLKWSFFAGLLLYGALHIAGIYMFPANVRSTWSYYSVFVAVNIASNSILSIMEGVGRVIAVSVVRAMQSTFFVLTLFVFTKHGRGLLALPVSLLISQLPIIVWMIWNHWPLVLGRNSRNNAIQWHKEILPLQWRVAISWMAGYFVFQAPITFLYKVVGPEEAGQLGLSMQIFQALTTLANILLSVRTKIWTRMAVHEQYYVLRCDLWLIIRRCVGVVILGAVLLIVLRWQLFLFAPLYSDRIVDIKAWCLLGFSAMANQIFYGLNYYFRAQGQEPLWVVAATAGLVAIIAGWLTKTFLSIDILVSIYFLISVIIHAGAGLFIYRIHVRM